MPLVEDDDAVGLADRREAVGDDEGGTTLQEPAQSRLLAALERVTPTERRALARGLGALVREMGIADGVAGMFFEEGAARTRGAARRRR